MAPLKLFVFAVLVSLIFVHIGVAADDGEVKVTGSDDPDSSILEQFKSKIHTLESDIEKKTREIKDKNEVIAAKEKLIKEKSDSIASLESEISSLQSKGKLDAAEQVGKAHARAGELEKQVEKLRKEIDLKLKEKDRLETRTTEAEKKAFELNSKFENLQKIIDHQKTKIRKTQRALQIAEEELMKAKFETTSKAKELMEVHGAWFPHWLVVHIANYQSLLEENWKVHGKPALETVIQKASEKKAQAEEWAAPHVETVKTKWVPAAKEKWIVIITNVKPQIHTLKTKTVEIYGVTKDAATPHIIKVQELADPYFQKLKKISKPYIDQAATAAKPHTDKLCTALKPHTDKVVHAYGIFLKSAKIYHHKVQDRVEEKLKSHELTEALATKELVWFSASAVLALPFFFLLKICSAVFGKKTKKPIRNGNSNNPRRKGKRVHSDK
ncbi:hypothetical protein ABFS83_01G042800 [Erythranthe nasuta]